MDRVERTVAAFGKGGRVEVDEALVAELQRHATGAHIHWAVGVEHAYRGLVKLSKTARTPERRTEAEREAAKVEQEIRRAMAEWASLAAAAKRGDS